MKKNDTESSSRYQKNLVKYGRNTGKVPHQRKIHVNRNNANLHKIVHINISYWNIITATATQI